MMLSDLGCSAAFCRLPHDASGQFDFISAAETHVACRARLGQFVRGAAHEPIEATLFQHDRFCALGRWIDGPLPASVRESDAYLRLRDAHLLFQRLGNLIVEHLQKGDRSGAAILYKNQYSAALRGMIHALAELNRQACEARVL